MKPSQNVLDSGNRLSRQERPNNGTVSSRKQQTSIEVVWVGTWLGALGRLFVGVIGVRLAVASRSSAIAVASRSSAIAVALWGSAIAVAARSCAIAVASRSSGAIAVAARSCASASAIAVAVTVIQRLLARLFPATLFFRPRQSSSGCWWERRMRCGG